MDIARITATIQNNATQAKDDIDRRLADLGTQASLGHIPSPMTVEGLYAAHYVSRLWNQIVSVTGQGVQAQDLDQTVKALRTWYGDALEQITSPGHSSSTSFIRTAEAVLEMEAMKIVARKVAFMIRNFSS